MILVKLRATCVAVSARGVVDCRHIYVLVRSGARIELLLRKAARRLVEEVRNSYKSVAEVVQIPPP